MKLSEIYMRDPCVVADNGKYYMTGTTDKNWFGGKSGGIKIYVSEDLVNFEGPYTVFEPNDSFWSFECWWAPELHKYRGKYYIFCTFGDNDKKLRASQILVSDTILGKYTPVSENPVTPMDWQSLDATLYVEDDVPYTVFCHEWTQIYNGEMCYCRLSENLSESTSKPITMFDAKSVSWTNGLNNHDTSKFEDYITDGPYLHKMKDNTLLMIWSSFKEGLCYSIGMAVSDNGKIDGKWSHRKELLFEKDGGHGMVFQGLDSKLYCALHVNNSNLGSEYPQFFEIKEENGVLKII